MFKPSVLMYSNSVAFTSQGLRIEIQNCRYHRQKSRTFCSRVHWSAEYVILQWDKNKMAARTSKTDQGRDKFHTKYGMI